MSGQAQAAVFAGPGQPLRIEHFDLPAPGADEVLVRVVGCTLCGSDVHTFQGKRTVPLPTILGHEILGRIEAFGQSAARRDFAGRELRVGDRVTWAVVASCGECFFCRNELPQKCQVMVKYGHEALAPGRELTGGLASHCLLVRGTALLRVPKSLPDEVACPANCATATIAAALEAAGNLDGRVVLVLGTGMLGLTACAMASSRRAEVVIGCDANEQRLEKSRAFGTTHVARPDELARVATSAAGRHGVDVALELTGSPAAFENAWPTVRTGGTWVLVGSVCPSRPVPLVLEDVVRRQLTVRGVHNYAPHHLTAALDFLDSQRRFPFAELVTRWLPLEEVDEAFTLAQQPGVFRVGVRAKERGV